MAEQKIKRALIAVYDKTGITDFARALVDEFGIEIISTGGTAKHLKDAGIPVTLVEEVTGFPEMLDGRVKTLHPKIHAAILADRDIPEHMRQLEQHGIKPIDMVVVNLYPFEKTVADPNCTFEQAIEMIDIGGPCLLRAAAKNFKHVWPVCEPRLCQEFLSMMREPDPEIRLTREEEVGCRRTFADIAFRKTSDYDASIESYFLQALSRETQRLFGKAGADFLPRAIGFGLHRVAECRYGENPQQMAAAYGFVTGPKDAGGLSVLRGGYRGQPSFNNFADADAALGLCAELTRAGRAILWDRLIAGQGLTVPGGGPSRQPPPIAKQQVTRRHLPHIQRPGATYFITFRLADGELSAEERDIAMECCLFPDSKKASIHAVVVMHDHVHILLTPLEQSPDNYFQLGDILHGIKGVSARRIVDQGRPAGKVWQDESWDRIMRDEKEFLEKFEYIRTNPTKDGLDREGPYPWVVYEPEPAWNQRDSAAYVQRDHRFLLDYEPEEGTQLARSWHWLLAHGPPSASGGGTDRLLAGPTKLTTAARTRSISLFIKHTNACGVGIADDPIEAYRRAYLGDPNAAMGGTLAVNFDVDPTFAEAVMHSLDRWGKAAGAGAFFVEVWVAPSFDDQAVEVIRTAKKWGENVRLLAVDDMTAEPDASEMDYKKIAGGMLVQTRDLVGLNEEQWKVVTKREPSESEMSDLRLAWLIAKHTKSNAISICKDGMLIGNGAGQMSRVMSCRIATWLATENGHAEKLAGSAAASDAFFPFRDGPEILIDAGVTAIIQPGGSKRDEETINACDERGVAMIFTGTRHFKH